MEKLPAEIVVLIARKLDHKSLANFVVNNDILSILNDKRFLHQWFDGYRIPVSVSLVAESTFSDVFDACRYIHDLGEAAIKLAKVYIRTFEPTRKQAIETAFLLSSENPSYFVWAACLTDNWRLAYSLYRSYGFPCDGGRPDVYFDLLLRYGRWKEVRISLPNGRRLDASRWAVTKVPIKWSKYIFFGLEHPNVDVLKGRGFLLTPGVIKRSSDEYLWHIITSPHISAKEAADVLKYCEPKNVFFALYARGQEECDFMEREKYSVTLPGFCRANWTAECRKRECLSSSTYWRAVFMREGLQEDDLNPLFDLLPHGIPPS